MMYLFIVIFVFFGRASAPKYQEIHAGQDCLSRDVGTHRIDGGETCRKNISTYYQQLGVYLEAVLADCIYQTQSQPLPEAWI